MALTRVTKTGNITVDGNVGISELNPGHKLHINGGSNDEARVRVTNTANGQASLDLNNSEGYFRTYTDAGEYRIYDQTDGVHRFVIDTEGRVTKPSQPSFMVYRNGGNYSVGAGQTVSIIYDTARYNTGGHFNNSNYRFTAPIDGLYNFSGSVNHYNLPAGTRLRIQLHLNGQLTIMGGYIRMYDTGDHNVVFNSSLKLSANDYVEMKRYSDGASAAGTSSGQLWNWFSGYLIG